MTRTSADASGPTAPWRSAIAASLAAACAAVLAAVLYADHVHYRRQVVTTFQQGQLTALRSQAARVEDLLADQARDLRFVAQDADVIRATPAMAKKLRSCLAIHRPILVNVGRTDADGQVVFQATKEEEAQEFSSIPEFVAARQTGRERLGPCHRSGPSAAFRVLVPILSEGKFNGVVFASVDLDAVWAKCLSCPRGQVWVVDAAGMVLHHADKGRHHRGLGDDQGFGDVGAEADAFASIRARVADGEEGHCRLPSSAGTGEAALAAFTPVRAIDQRWGLATVWPASALDGAVASHARLTGVLVTALAMVFGMAACLAGRAVRATLVRPKRAGQAAAGKPRRELSSLAGGQDPLPAPAAIPHDLHAARLAAESANRAKSEFLANMSHEIRTPLTAILGFADLLDDPDADPAEAREWLAAIRRNGQHLLTLIGGILDLSKIEAGKRTLDLRPCNLVGVVSDVVEMMRAPARQAGLLLAAEYVGELPETITADEAAVRQVLINLVGNAVKFTDRGSVRVTLSFLPAWRDGRPAVRVQVADTGSGIAPELVPRLGEAFYQAPPAGRPPRDGTGLGLTIARRLIEMHGGELTVQTALGEGSVFGFILPAGPLTGVRMLPGPPAEPADAGPAAGADAPGPLAQLRILVAEDSPDSRRLIAAVLRKAGARVQFAEDGAAAVRIASENPFDVVLMDIEMPELNGRQAALQLRRHGTAVPIIALTAHAMAGDRDECLAAGCTDYLTKPIDRNLLLQTIARHARRPARAA